MAVHASQCMDIFFPPGLSEAIVGGSYYGAPAISTPPYRVQQNVKNVFHSPELRQMYTCMQMWVLCDLVMHISGHALRFRRRMILISGPDPNRHCVDHVAA